MDFKLKYYITLVVLFCNSFAFAQFNTLIHTSIKKEEGFPTKEEFQKVENGKVEKEKKNDRRINFFNITTKADLKRDIDSLKKIVLKFTLSKNKEETEKRDLSNLESQKRNFKKVKDSIIQFINGTTTYSTKSNSRPSINQNNFLNENVPNQISKIFNPLKNGITVTSPFGFRVHPIFGVTKMHNGADLKANYENVFSILDGIVSEAGWDHKGGGKYIKIKNSKAFTTSFLHLSEIYYKVGEFVKAGFIIAKSGNSGNSTGAHLHFSVTENGKYINPIRFLNDLTKTNNLIATYYAK